MSRGGLTPLSKRNEPKLGRKSPSRLSIPNSQSPVLKSRRPPIQNSHSPTILRNQKSRWPANKKQMSSQQLFKELSLAGPRGSQKDLMSIDGGGGNRTL